MPHKRSRKTRPLRIDCLFPPELTSSERDIYLVAMSEGIVQALEDFPQCSVEAAPIAALAIAACRETDARQRAVYIEAYKGGYIGFRAASEVDPDKVYNQVTEAKMLTYEQRLQIYLEKTAANLARLYLG